MENLLNPNIEFTDPDTLQFCLKLSDKEFWYCEPNRYHEKLLPDVDSVEGLILDTLSGYPKDLIRLSSIVTEVKEFISDRKLWMSGSIEIDDFDQEEKLELLADYGYKWDGFDNDADRNQIICENHFESYPLDYRNDI